MNNEILWLFFFLFSFSSLQGQTSRLFGSYSNSGLQIFNSLELSNQTFTDVNVLNGVSTLNAGQSTFDSVNGRYFNIANLGVTIIDAQTGVILTTVSTNGRVLKGIEYDASSNKLFGSYWNGSQEILTALDLLTNTFSDIGVLNGVLSLNVGESTFDSANGRYFNITNLGVTIVDVQTGSILGIITTGGRRFKGIEYDSDKLYGSYWNGSQEIFTTLDLLTNTFSDINVLNGVLFLNIGESTFDSVNGRYFNITNLGITEIDVQTGNILQTTTPPLLRGLEYGFADIMPASIIISCPANNLNLPMGCNPTIPLPNIASPTIILGSGIITHEGDLISDVGCTRTVSRTYRATDGNGNFDECVQAFTFEWDEEAPVINEEALPIQLGLDINGEGADDLFGWSTAISGDGSRLAVGARWKSDNGDKSGQTKIYEWNGTIWTQLGANINGDVADAESGWSVALSFDGNRLAVGAIGNTLNGNNAGLVKIYDWDGLEWKQVGNNIEGVATFDRFGYSVALSDNGNRLAVGATANDENGPASGQVKVYEWDGVSWLQMGGNLNGSGSGSLSGWSVALSSSGNRLVIGAVRNEGRVKIYEWNGTSWIQLGNDIFGDSSNDKLGWSVDLSGNGDRVVMGGPESRGSPFNSAFQAGIVKVYNWNGTRWSQVGGDITGRGIFHRLGQSVAISSDGNRISVSCPGEEHTRVYNLRRNSWVKSSINANGNDYRYRGSFGYSIDMSSDGSRLVVGGPFNGVNGINSGYARAFELMNVGSCPDDITISCESSTLPAVTGEAFITDNCTTPPITTYSDSLVIGSCPSEEVIFRKWVGTDACGNITSCQQKITVEDVTIPIVRCRRDLLVIELDSNGQAILIPEMLDGGSTDNCTAQSDLIFSASQTIFTCDDINSDCRSGSLQTFLTVTDACGNSSTCGRELIRVVDNIAPKAVCKDIQLTIGVNGQGILVPEMLDGGSYDNGGFLSFSVNQTVFTCDDLNDNCEANQSVVLTVTDKCGNTDNCVANVLLVDASSPIRSELITASQLGATIFGERRLSEFGNAVAFSADGNRLAIGTKQHNGSGPSSGDVQVYDWDGNNWVKVGMDINGEAAFDESGIAVALSTNGNRLVIGASRNNGSASNSGHIRIYDWDGTSWNQVGEDIDGANSRDFFGLSVGIASGGNRVIASSSTNDNNGISSGHVRIYDWDGTRWNQVGEDIDGKNSNEFFGSSVTITPDGNRIVVGAAANNINSGRVRVYDWDGMNWNQVGEDIDGANIGDFFGASVAITSDGNRIVIGATASNSNGTGSGQARIFDWDGMNWNQIGKNINGDNAFDRLGKSVAISSNGNRIAVSASGSGPGNGLDIGYVRIYDWNKSDWVLAYEDIGGNRRSIRFGDRITLSSDGSRLGVSAPYSRRGSVSRIGMVETYELIDRIEVQCEEFVNLDSLEFVDNCSINLNITFSDQPALSNTIGETIIQRTWAVSDDCDNTSSFVQLITLVDLIAPTPTCQDLTLQLDANGQATLTASQLNNGSTDNCTAPIDLIFSASQTAFSCTNLNGACSTIIPVTLRVEDGCGNIDSCIANVTLQDSVAPSPSCQDLTLQLDANGQATLTASQLNNGSTDNCTAPTALIFSASQTTFSCTDLNGACSTIIPVTLRVEDGCGNIDSCIANVTLQDSVAPSPNCQDLTLQLDANGQATLTASQLNNGSTDNCTSPTDLTFSASQTMFTCSDLNMTCDGSVLVTLTVTDECDNSATCIANVFIEDTIAPTPSCQDLTLQLDANGQATLTASQLNNGSTDNCTAPTALIFSASQTTFSCTDLNGTCSMIIPVTLRVEDGCGNIDSCIANVTLQDNAVPAAICRDLTVQLDENGRVTINPIDLNAGSTDNCTATNDLIFNASQTLFTCDDLNATCDGSIPVTLSVTDQCGNAATCVANVFVEDNRGPNFINCLGDFAVTLDPGDCFFIYDFNIEATDNCSSDVEIRQTAGPRSGVQLDHTTSTFFAFEAEDACGNITLCQYNVTVNEFPFIDTELACNDNVQISLDENCEAIVGADLILEGGQYGCYDTRYGVIIDFNQDGVFEASEGNALGAADVGMTYNVQVTDLVTGNSCWGSIEVEDKLIPDLHCEPITALCSDDLFPEVLGFPITGRAVATSNGDGTYTVSGFDGCGDATLSFVDTEDPRQCQTINKVITRSWTIVDGSGNSNSCDQLISLERATLMDVMTPPNWDNTEEEALSCENRCDDTDTRFCGPDNLYWNVLPVGHPYAGNPNPEAELWGCGAVKCFGTGVPGGVTCGDIQFTFQDARINICATGPSDGCFKVLRKWTILDWCTGESIFHNQIIKVEDTRGPQINDLENVTISTDVWRCEADWYATIPWIEDNCSSEPINYIVESSAGTVELVNGRWKINSLPLGTHEVSYIATDCCGNESIRRIRLTVIDDVPPVPVCDEHTVVSLSTTQNTGTNGLGRTSIPASVFDDGSFDNCGAVTFRARRTDFGCGSTSFSSFVDFCCSDIGARGLMVELQVTDQARNTSICMIQVEVQDKQVPTLVSPPDITVTCDYWFPFDPDNPDENLEALDERFGKIVDLVGEGAPDSIIVRDRVCEVHPRFGEFAPASIFDDPCYDTQYDIFWGYDGYGVDNCGFELEQTVIPNLHCGRGDILRRWRAADPFGNWSNTVTQRITIIDCKEWYVPTVCWRFTPRDIAECDLINIPGTGLRYRTKLIEWPCDVEITTCYGQGTEPDVFHPENLQVTFEQDRRPRFDDDNCNLLAATYTDEVFTFVDGACLKILRSWKVIDWCLYEDFQNGTYQGAWSWEWTQVIKLLNQEGPSFDSCEDLTFCGYGDPDNPNNPQCVGIIELVPEIEDDCTESEELKIDFKLDAFNDGTYDILGYSDNHGNVYPFPNPNFLPVRRFLADEANADGTYPVGTHRILWGVEDGCGNATVCEYLFTIEDCKPPIAYCEIGVSTIPMPQEAGAYLDIWANDFNLGSTDNCTDAADLIFSFSDDINDRSRRLTCRDAGSQLNYTIYVWDEAGNYSSCLVGVVLNNCRGNSTYNITGEISDEEGRMIEEVEVDFSGTTNITEVMTDITGFFNFLNEEAGQNITITPEKDINPRNGVTTFDIVLMSKHILGIQELNSPYKMIAADVNQSGTITTFDMVELRKLILFIDNNFRNNTSWRFVDKAFVFPNTSNPFETSFPEIYSINDLAEDEQADFVGVKIGDVNGSASPNSLINSEERSNGNTLLFNIMDQKMVAGMEYEIDFLAKDFKAIAGYQFSLNFDTDALEFAGIESGVLPQLDAGSFGTSLLSRGVLTTSWNRSEGLSIDDEAIAFTVVFRAKKDAFLSESLSVGSDYTVAQAYNQALEIMAVDIAFKQDQPIASRFELMQNQPNPFRAETVIGFTLPQAGAATMTFYDVSGRILRLIKGDYAQGYNEISINRSELPGGGLLYYTLETATDRASKRMILLE